MASSSPFCSFDIATSVINLHYENKLGYIPIVKSLHEKFHNGYLQIPMNLIHGNWKYMLSQFSFDDDDMDTITSRLAINKNNCGWTDRYTWKRQAYTTESEESE